MSDDARLQPESSNEPPNTLLLAAEAGDVSAAFDFLQAGSNANESTSTGTTALMKAAHAGHAEVVKLLLQHGADAAAHDSTNGSTALILAAAQGHVECVMLLLAASGTSPAERDSEGRSPILYAARRGDVETLRLLLTAAPT